MRSPLQTLAVLAFVLSAPLAEAHAQRPDVRQIHWQRRLEDARALALQTQRPLWIALNMDGESASDRIVHENYRDPAFVAATRDCICLVGSLFRHTPRDHDDQGRRIPCPRLGHVTCGEHVALEPQLYEEFLSDGERVAPRHSLVLPSGEKVVDVSLSFDLKDIDRALFEALAAHRAPRDTIWRHEGWPALAARRDHLGRARLEQWFAEPALDAASLVEGLRAVAAHGDDGSLDALRVVAARWSGLRAPARAAWRDTVAALDLRTGIRDVLLEQLAVAPTRSFAEGGRLANLAALAAVAPDDALARTVVLAHRAVRESALAADTALRDMLDPAVATRLQEVLGAHAGGSWSLAALARTVRRAERPFTPRPRGIGRDLPARDELLDRLGALDRELAARSSDGAEDGARPLAEVEADYAMASLELARVEADAGGKNVPILLDDAELHFGRSLELEPDQPRLWIGRARCAYMRSAVEEQIAHGRRALELAAGVPFEAWQPGPESDSDRDELAVEAARWIAGGCGLRLGMLSGGDDAVAEFANLVDGLRAHAAVVVTPFGDARDWISLSSFCAGAGLRHEAAATAFLGSARIPAAGDLRQQLNSMLWSAGRDDEIPVLADALAAVEAPSADSLWFAAYAHVLAAESARRAERHPDAVSEYAMAARRFDRVRELEPGYDANCRYWIGATWIGRGLAHVRTGDREEAARCLVQAVGTGADLTEARDGLGYDVLDLVDKIQEWRADGPSPVDPGELLAMLAPVLGDAAGGGGFYALAVSDSALREALRADGRNPERAMRRTVDAAGEPIEMMMGLPCEEGDRLLRASIETARVAVERSGGSEETRRSLAQSATIWAERMLERDRLDGVAEALAEASRALGMEPLGDDAGREAFVRRAATLRDELGEARPRWRMGR